MTWQPSADQHRLIGHMILHKSNGTQGDLGLKVSFMFGKLRNYDDSDTGGEEKELNKRLCLKVHF